jgi:hypothetical protein
MIVPTTLSTQSIQIVSILIAAVAIAAILKYTKIEDKKLV